MVCHALADLPTDPLDIVVDAHHVGAGREELPESCRETAKGATSKATRPTCTYGRTSLACYAYHCVAGKGCKQRGISWLELAIPVPVQRCGRSCTGNAPRRDHELYGNMG